MCCCDQRSIEALIDELEGDPGDLEVESRVF